MIIWEVKPVPAQAMPRLLLFTGSAILLNYT